MSASASPPLHLAHFELRITGMTRSCVGCVRERSSMDACGEYESWSCRALQSVVFCLSLAPLAHGAGACRHGYAALEGTSEGAAHVDQPGCVNPACHLIFQVHVHGSRWRLCLWNSTHLHLDKHLCFQGSACKLGACAALALKVNICV